jgi:hypothetical protein
MTIVAILLCYLLGLAVLLIISRKYSLTELIGYSFLIGIGIETFFLFFLDIIGIKYSEGVLIGMNVFSIVALLGINFKNLKEFQLDPNPKTYLHIRNINFPALMVGGIIAYLFYCVTVKCLFWPPLERDSMGSFDKLARVMAVEGKMKISLYDYALEGAGGVYPPLFHASMAYVYIFGAEIPKIITTLFFLSTLLVFFDITRKFAGATAASFFTLIFMLTPEYFSHAALALGNLPTTAYVCGGGLCTLAWLEKREAKFFWLGAILMAFVVWVRGDTIVFTAAALLLMAIDFIRKKDWKKAIIYSVIVLAPFILWTLYLKFKIHNVPSGKFDFGIGFDSERWNVVKGYTDAYLFGGEFSYKGLGSVDGAQFYGLAFVLFFFTILANAIFLAILFYRKREWKKALTSQMNVLLFFFASFIAYFLLFYFIDEKVQSSPIWSLMYSSFKRGLFCFLPIAFFYIATSYGSAPLFEKIEKFRTVS